MKGMKKMFSMSLAQVFFDEIGRPKKLTTACTLLECFDCRHCLRGRLFSSAAPHERDEMAARGEADSADLVRVDVVLLHCAEPANRCLAVFDLCGNCASAQIDTSR